MKGRRGDLALCPDADVARHSRLVGRLLDAQVRERVFTEDGARVHVRRHEAAFSRQRLQQTDIITFIANLL